MAMIWSVKDENDNVLFSSESYREAYTYWYSHTDTIIGKLYLDFEVVNM